jgi:hypothetical protein
MMQKGAEIIHIAEQYGDICMWAIVDTDAEQEKRCFNIVETGHEIYNDMGINRKYIGSVHLDGGSFVFHIFERI